MDVLLIIAMIATFGVLCWGMFGMMRGADPKKQNKAMVWRVGLQAISLVILVTIVMLSKQE